MVEAKSVPYMSPQYLTPLENPNGEYQYMPTGQVYNQMPQYNSSLTVSQIWQKNNELKCFRNEANEAANRRRIYYAIVMIIIHLELFNKNTKRLETIFLTRWATVFWVFW